MKRLRLVVTEVAWRVSNATYFKSTKLISDSTWRRVLARLATPLNRTHHALVRR